MENNNKIKISDITPDLTLSLIAALDDKKVDLPINYAKLSEDEAEEVKSKYGIDALPLEPIVRHIEEKILEISFKGHTSKLQLIVVTTEEVFHWKAVKIFRVKLASGRNINMLTSDVLYGEKFNRRRGVRINIDKMMKIEQGGEEYQVIVRDLSYCGVGFYEPLGSKVQKGMPFLLHLSESSDDGDRLVCKLTGKILHQREHEAGGLISGCVLSSQHASFLQRYIAIKQMEEISGRKQDMAAIQHTATGENWKSAVASQLNKTIME
jgi:hypothetical protein